MGTEWIVIGAVAILLFGGSQIPKLARSLGQAQKEFKTAQDDAVKSEPVKKIDGDENKES